MASVELWSDVGCATGAQRLAVVPDWLSCEYGESLAGDVGATLVLPDDSPAIASLAVRGVLRVYDDVDTFEYRILRWEDRLSSGRVTVTCSPIIHDLARAPIVQFSNGVALYSQASTSLTPTQWIDNYVLPSLTANGLTWISRGTVTPTGSVTVSWTEQTPLGLLRALVENTDYEVYLRRNGGTDYKIDLVTIDRSSGVNADALVGRNVTALRRVADGDIQATVVIPQGITPSGATRPAGLEQFQLKVETTPTGNPVRVIDPTTNARPFVVDDAVNSYQVAVPGLWHPWVAYDATQTTCGVSPTAYPGIYNSVDGCVWSTHTRGAGTGGSYLLSKFNARTGERLATYNLGSGTLTLNYTPRIVGFAPTGTAGYLLLGVIDTGSTLQLAIFDCSAGAITANSGTVYTFSLRGPAQWVGGSYNQWYFAADYWNTSASSGGQGVWSITTGGTATFVTGGGTLVRPPLHISGSDKLFMCTAPWVNPPQTSTYRTWDLATNALDAGSITLGFNPSWMYHDAANSRIWIGQGSYYGQGGYSNVYVVNDSTYALTDTITLPSGVLTADHLHREGGGPVAVNGFLYVLSTGASAKPLYRTKFDLAAKTHVSSTPLTNPSVARPGGVSYKTEASQWYDSELDGFWTHDAGAANGWGFSRDGASPAGVATATIADSALDNGSGVSTISFSGLQWKTLTGPYNQFSGTPRFYLRNANGAQLYEVPDAGAVASYGRIQAFLDGSPYGYRGEANLVLGGADFRDAVTLNGLRQCPGLLGADGRLTGATTKLSYVSTISQLPTGTASAQTCKINATTTSSVTVTLKELPANFFIPAGSLLGASVPIVANATADSSGIVTVTLDQARSYTVDTATDVRRPFLPAVPPVVTGSDTGVFVSPGLWYGLAQSVSFPVYIPPGHGNKIICKAYFALHRYSHFSSTAGVGQTYASNVSLSLGGTIGGTDLIAQTAHPDTTAYTDLVPRGFTIAVASAVSALGSHGTFAYLTYTGPYTFLYGVSVYLADTGEAATIGHWPYSAANDLWNYGIRVVRDYADVPYTYECEVLEDGTTFALGGRVNLRDPSRAVAATPRVVAMQRRMEQRASGLVVRPQITLDNRAASLVDGLVRKGSV